MTPRKRYIYGTISSIAVLLLIFDSKTAFIGANEGIKLCIENLIPSLFPFLIFTGIMNSALTGIDIPLFRPISKLLGIPNGGQSLLILGILGGYPVGAKAIYDTYKSGQISKESARRMLGFCNNAGPAFIFGIIGNLFQSNRAVFIVWFIHVASALLTGFLLPGKNVETCARKNDTILSFPQSLNLSIRTIASVCGWVIIFRMIIHFLNTRFVNILSCNIPVWVYGILELTNGCLALRDISSDGLKLIISSGLLSFGGLCIWMQTISVTKELGTGLYIPGKLLQTCISLLLAYMVVLDDIIIFAAVTLLGISIMLLIRHRKKVVA